MNDDPKLRSAAIRLAHENPNLREHLLPLLKTAEKEGEVIRIGDKVQILTRKGWVSATVLMARQKRTGGFDLQFSSEAGDLKFPAKSLYYADSSNARILKYVGKVDSAQAEKERDELALRNMERADAKEDFAEQGREALQKFDPRPGDRILISYRGGIKEEETVNGVNWKTGKVGVLKEKRRSPEEEARLVLVFQELNRLSGRNLRAPLERDTRWIPAHQIVRVVERFKP